jgi:hypothetical protein
MKDMQDKIDQVQNLAIDVDNKMDRKEFEDRMSKFAAKNTEIINNLRIEIQDIKKINVDLEAKVSKAIEIKLMDEIDKKIEEDVTWASVVARHVDERFESVKDDVYQIQDTIKETKNSVQETKNLITEERDKEGRKNNVIIYRMVESKAIASVDKQKDDKIFLFKLLHDILHIECEETDLKRVFRIGKKEDGKDRPLLIEFKSSLLKNRMMESLVKLADAEIVYKNLSVTHDMTKTERAEVKKLLEEAKEKQIIHGQGEWVYKVRGNPGNMRIVRIKKH